jgi:PST family polysaccharide transporter
MTGSRPGEVASVDHLKGDLRGRSVRGGTAMMITAAGRFVLNLGSTAILARVLTLSDFGLMAMAVTVTRFLSTFKDAGLSMATVQRSEIDHDQLSTLFWINGVFGIVLMVATVISAPLVAWFYGDPRLTGIVMLLAVGFAASGFSTQHHALLRRQMRFSLLAEVEIASLLVGAGLAILMARGGFGFWSLAAKELGPIIAILVGVAIGCRWRPGKPRFGSGVRPMLRFGGHLAGVNMVGYFTRNFDKVLIGCVWVRTLSASTAWPTTSSTCQYSRSMCP